VWRQLAKSNEPEIDTLLPKVVRDKEDEHLSVGDPETFTRCLTPEISTIRIECFDVDAIRDDRH
jgi:hypothetical protein